MYHSAVLQGQILSLGAHQIFAHAEVEEILPAHQRHRGALSSLQGENLSQILPELCYIKTHFDFLCVKTENLIRPMSKFTCCAMCVYRVGKKRSGSRAIILL